MFKISKTSICMAKTEDHQPSGTCNFSRIDTARLITGAPLATGDCVYAVNYNVVRIVWNGRFRIFKLNLKNV